MYTFQLVAFRPRGNVSAFAQLSGATKDFPHMQCSSRPVNIYFDTSDIKSVYGKMIVILSDCHYFFPTLLQLKHTWSSYFDYNNNTTLMYTAYYHHRWVGG